MARSPDHQLVLFTLDAQSYALRLASVRRVVHTVAVTPLPKAPNAVLGVIEVAGDVIPVLSMRKRFGLPEPEIGLSGQFILADTGTRTVALVVNAVVGVIERSVDEVTKIENIAPGADYVDGISSLEDGILLIHDVDRFLSEKEDHQLHRLLAQAGEAQAGESAASE